MDHRRTHTAAGSSGWHAAGRIHPASRTQTRSSWRDSPSAGSTCLRPPVATIDFRRSHQLIGNVGGILGSDALRAMGHDDRLRALHFDCRRTVGGAAAQTGGRRARAARVASGPPGVAVGGGARLLLDSGATTVTVFNDSRRGGEPALERAVRRRSVRIDRLDGAKMGRLGELACSAIGGDRSAESRPSPSAAGMQDRRAGPGWAPAARPLLQGAYFTRRGLHRADPHVTPLNTPSGRHYNPFGGCLYFSPHTSQANLSRRGASRAHHTPAPIQREAQTPLTVSQTTTHSSQIETRSTRRTPPVSCQQPTSAPPRANPPLTPTSARTRSNLHQPRTEAESPEAEPAPAASSPRPEQKPRARRAGPS